MDDDIKFTNPPLYQFKYDPVTGAPMRSAEVMFLNIEQLREIFPKPTGE